MTHLKELMAEFHTILHELSLVLEAPRPGECEAITPARLKACTARKQALLAQLKERQNG